MANINLDKDIIYEYWRWQYIRRNEVYLYDYDEMASYLNQLGVQGFNFVHINEYKKQPNIRSILVTDRELSENEVFVIKMCLAYFVLKYKIALPFHPSNDGEITSADLLERILNDSLNYFDLPRAPYQEILTVYPRYQIDESKKRILEANEKFLKQNPQFKLPENFFPSKESTKKFNVFNPGSKKQANKEKKYLKTWQNFLKQEDYESYIAFQKFERDRKKIILQNRGKRIKSNQLARAVGLYLWDNWNAKKIDIINNFLETYEEDRRLGESFKNEDNLRKRLNITDECINQREVNIMF